MLANGMENVVCAYAGWVELQNQKLINKSKLKVTDRDGLGKLFVCQECQIAVDVVTGEPASASIQFAIPPTTRITIEDSDHLPGAEGKTGGVSLLWDVVMHGENEFRLRWLGGHQICREVCVDGSLRV
jgi:hypothetical protein